jgi:hypothetical protein
MSEVRMTLTIPDLWPSDVAVTEVLTPLAILRYQAGQLRAKSKGLLEAEVTTETVDEDRTAHLYLELVAPALDRYRYRLLHAWHANDFVYPVNVQSNVRDEPFLPPGSQPPVAATQEQFLELVGAILSSSKAKSVVQSLIAQSNDVRGNAPSWPPPPNP